MAKTTKTPGNTDYIADDDPGILRPATVDDRENEDTEAMILAEFGQSDDSVTWKVSVYRAASRGEPEPYLFSCSPADFPIIDRLRDEYGSGVYRVRVFKNNRVHRYFTVSVEARRAPALPVPVITPANDGLAAALERQTQLLERLINQRQQPQNTVDPFSMMTTLLGAIGQIKGLFGTQAASGPENAIELFMKGIEAAKELGGGGKGDSSLMDIVRDLLKSPIVEKMIEGAAANAGVHQPMIARPQQPGIGEAPSGLTAQPPQQTAQPQPPANGETVNQQAPPPVDDPRLVQMVHNIRYLATKAASNADTELYADWVLDNVPADLLAQMINDPNALATLTQVVPEAAPYQGWFGQVLALVKHELTEQELEVQDMGHVQPGPASNANGVT